MSLDPNSLFSALIATAVDGIIVIDEQGVVQVYNNACERLFGYAAAEVTGRNVNMLMPPPYRDEHDGYLAHYHETGEKRVIGIGREVVGRRKDQSTFPMYLSLGEGTLDGNHIFVGIIHDLTESKRTGQRLQEMQNELLHVSRLSAMGQMSAAIAHELNQPLTAVTNYIRAADRMLEGAGEAIPQVMSAREALAKAATQTVRAGAIIRQLREFVEKRESRRTPHNVNKVLEEAITLSFVGIAHLNVRMKLDIDPDIPPIPIDRIQIQQVFVNLIRNALEAMADSPVREIAMATRGNGDRAEVTIRDTGPGLPAEVLARLFQPFVTTKEKGMGIGLTICQSIIEAHGGSISPEDAAPGARFLIRLPIKSG